MQRRANNQSPEQELDRVRQEFERWRATRKRGARIPEPLWTEALGVAHTLGVSRISQELRLDYHSLRARMEPQDSRGPVVPAFVEFGLPMEPLRPECVIVAEKAGAGRIRIELRGVRLSDLMAVVVALWGGGQCSS